MQIELSATGNDALSVENAVFLAGAVSVSLLGGFEPMMGDSFEILSASSISGGFEFLDLPTLAVGMFDVVIEPTRVVLEVVCVPEPATSLMLPAGGLFLALLSRLRNERRSGTSNDSARRV